MELRGEPKAYIRSDAKDFIDLYRSLGERAENFLPNHILGVLNAFVRLCYEEPDDPVKQQAEIDKYILELKEAIPGYVDVSLMLFPHDDSKAFQYRTKKHRFTNKLTYLIDTEAVDEGTKKQALNILNCHDYSIGTPPVTQQHFDLMYNIYLGDHVRELRKFRSVIGIKDDIEEALWNYLMDVLEQMIIQSSHYTTVAEKKDFLDRTELTINYKGLNGFIRTVVAGSADTAINLIKKEMFGEPAVKVFKYKDADTLYEQVKNDTSKILIVKAKHVRKNVFHEYRWFPLLSRLIIVDDSLESQSTNTSLVFAFHNKIINTLNKVHTKKLGALANSQLNLRLILDKVNEEYLRKFRDYASNKIKDYEEELKEIKTEQLGETNNLSKDNVLFKFDGFAKQIIHDKYTITKLRDYLNLLLQCKNPKNLKNLNAKLIDDFEKRVKAYFYSNIEELQIATIVEGGGRTQIKTYGEYLLQRRLMDIDTSIVEKCKIILDIIPNNYQRTLHNHFHKNFGLNLFLEKYKEYITKVENEADNKGRFANFLIDLGIKEEYDKKNEKEKNIIKDFIGNLGNLEKTSISDDVQMIIRDILFDRVLKPYILFNPDASWEYKDLFPVDRFDINPFDLEIGVTAEGRIDFERLHLRLIRMKSTFQLFDDTGNLWDKFCENLTIIINDPSNPAGYTDFNNVDLIKFLRFLNNSKITLFLDEAYSDAVKINDPDEPKWRTISRYIMNNISSLPNISMVSSLSTTKNLGATGNRLGPLISTPAKKDVIEFARSLNKYERVNTNSALMLVNVLEVAQLSKKTKDRMEAELPKNASRYKIKERLEKYIRQEIESERNKEQTNLQGDEFTRFSPFEGSPLHLFMLDELLKLDKLDVLQLPDDFKFKGEPFFTYYREHIVKELNKFRINKVFRSESNRRMKMAKKIAAKVTAEFENNFVQIVESDGSYLFNLRLSAFFSYQDLEKFTKRLTSERGIAVIPYKTGFLRFSLGDYINGSEESYKIFGKEFENSLRIVLTYWEKFYNEKKNPGNSEKRTDDILDEIFRTQTDKQFVEKVLEDFSLIRKLEKEHIENLKISNIMTLYHAFPKDSGVSINTILGSENSVFEFYDKIGECLDLRGFIKSKAFTKIYENLLPQIYKKIPLIKNLDYNSVICRYGKPTILKYVENKLSFQPNSYILDEPDERSIMAEILVEMEKILFSDAKVKILALKASDDLPSDIARLEGCNQMLKKHIKELLLHFNLPFEKESAEPTINQVVEIAVIKFADIVGKHVTSGNITLYIDYLLRSLQLPEIEGLNGIQNKISGFIIKTIHDSIDNQPVSVTEKLQRLFLLIYNNEFKNRLKTKLQLLHKELKAVDDDEMRLINEDYIFRVLPGELNEIVTEIFRLGNNKISDAKLHPYVRNVVLLITEIMNKSKSNEYYDRYNHSLITLTEAEFKKQNSSVNEMIQHGFTLHENFEMKDKTLETYENGILKWINDVMTRCGVIATECPVQTHTRIVTDAKKREYPFHKVDRLSEIEKERKTIPAKSSNEFIKSLYTRPSSMFFVKRMAKFVENMDSDDFRCKLAKHGLVKVLFVFQKCYIKYLTDCFRLMTADNISLEDAQNFVPDAILFFGAPEKVISFPQVGYFDIPSPNGDIKIMVTPLKKKVDYFGDIKKPWLTVTNEKIKEKGGIPIHGSLFAVEEEDGAVFVVQVDGDSGVGKSEMLAAMMLQWMKNNLPGVRSLRTIAGDMFYLFPDTEGNLYGIGTEVGDFSRTTDFDPEYIRYYNSLFESSADSNVTDKNARSTISGLCNISMPYKIDIMLTASNFAREEAGITRYENPENFIIYRDSHGERKEKATSSDNPHFQRTLSRYTSDKAIVEILDKHGNYIDEVLDWDKDEDTDKFYLCSAYKIIDKIDIEDIVNKIFKNKQFKNENGKYIIRDISFDIIKNRFSGSCEPVIETNEDSDENTKIKILIDREVFSSIFNSLASTPSGQPFVAENEQLDGKRHLIDILKGAKGKAGKGRNIQLGILSTDLGRKGKEITGPQRAAEDMKKMIQEIRIERPEINDNKTFIKNIISEKYGHIFNSYRHNSEIWRYNFFLFQMEQMRKATFVRIDDMKTRVDMTNIKGFEPVDKKKDFSPLLVTPNTNIELSSFTETCEQLMDLPNNKEFADEFYKDSDKLYFAEGYSKETIINNCLLQLLLMNGYIMVEDLTRGRITEKVNRETLAAAKSSIYRKLKESQTAKEDNRKPVAKKQPKTNNNDNKTDNKSE